MLNCRRCQIELTDTTWSPWQRKNQSRICRKCAVIRQQEWRAKNPEKARESHRRNMAAAYKRNGREKVQARNAVYRKKVVAAYGGACACCGETLWQFLEVDHIQGGGNKHRRELGIKGGYAFYLWLQRRGFPKDQFRLLCSNCNKASAVYGECPHKSGVG